ncbi:TetR/AcrR family transcriptional regulator [Microcella alkalica]|uniref:AcrR family transcriptional regulator n=1 Tax=Microcella alkalica TaxID=355930 RepID=A0A839E8T3_9MICO|nr:TetR/AcrR family transcriptional regulator [Microcella alkalica]MBA8847603.1 AcrR family transcriptional regulator [Microcella alkalica]
MNEPRRRGRPVELDLERVAHVALDLFREHGYDDVTMEDIARVVGHSRRTIFRHFPAKASLVWAGTEGFAEVLRAEIAAADSSLPAIDAVRAAYVAAAQVPPELREVTRQRLLLIGDNHTLYSDGVARFADVGDAIRQAFIVRDGLDPDGLDAAIVGDTLVLVAHRAFIWWARHGEGAPGPVLEAAFDRVADGLRPR